MTKYARYRTALEIVAEGIVLKDHDYVESTGAEGALIENLGAAPFEVQPFADQEKWDPSGKTTNLSAKRAYRILADYLAEMDEDCITQNLHIVHPDDIIEIWEE